MNSQRAIRSLLYGAQKDWEVAESLFKHKHYAHALFLCHLVLEKVLKALVLKRTKEFAPQIHDLRRLAEKAVLNFTKEQSQEFDIITTFNIRARYDDTKRTFYQKATQAYAKRYLDVSREMYKWLLKELRSKK
jgi:AbiV family abortive infection protein